MANGNTILTGLCTLINKMPCANLVRILQAASQNVMQLVDGAGASVFVLPYGARVLALAPAETTNLFWVNPALSEVGSAKDFFREPGWRNTGGDRTWISPERDLHVCDLSDPWRSYEVPESVDPGCYSAEFTNDRIVLVGKAMVEHCRTGQRCTLELKKSIRMVPDPLRYEPAVAAMSDAVKYAGYEQITSLAYVETEEESQFPVSIWDAIELPAAGQIAIPTSRNSQPCDFFEPTGANYLRTSSTGLQFRVDGKERHKIAVRATDLIGGRAAYFRRVDHKCTLVIRNFAIDPSAEYVDTPWQNPLDKGYVLECYNDGGINGLYGELEYHSPAMGNGTGGASFLVDRAQVWGFEGPEREMAAILERFVGEALAQNVIRHAL